MNAHVPIHPAWSDMNDGERADLVRPLIEGEGMSYAEVARRFGITRSSVAGVVYRARTNGDRIKRKHVPRTKAMKPARGRAAGGRTATLQERMRRARESGPPIPTVIDRRPARDRAWDALPGTTPTRERDHDGCRWPLGLAPPYLWCNAPTGGQTYCPAHTTMAHAPVKKGTEK